ncbi:unnamed protein product [Rotaria sordida]|uniref:PDZ domain-containing protein n=1 Tax=Rotaria sordida TaxID=392033 RepID=A0A815JSL5_9BILA|nr:unnamed protein product [Rotaria sordida]CAF3956488.1 unnamed protein product [Rotaria sordida]
MMTTTVHSNPVYHSASSSQNSSTRNVVLHKGPDQSGFGIYIGEDIPSGLYIVTVDHNSPAADANIQPGDRVLAINGQSVSSMTKDPKEILFQAATNNQRLTLTIQSTSILQTLNMPLTNNYKPDENFHKQQTSSKRTFDKNSDLESYLKSILGNDNIQIVPLPNSLYNNEFILKSSSYPSHRSRSKGRKHDHHHHHHHRSHPKRKILETKETQTSMDDSQDENILQEQPNALLRQYPLQPSMGTSQRMLRTQQLPSNDDLISESNDNLISESNDNLINESNDSQILPKSRSILSSFMPEIKPTESTTKTALPEISSTGPVFGAVQSPAPDRKPNNPIGNIRSPTTQHMTNVVDAAVAASRNNREPAKKPEEIFTGQPVNVTKQTTAPPPYQPSPSINKRTDEPIQNQISPLPNIAPTYTNTPAKPVDNPVYTNEGSYNVRNAQENQQQTVAPNSDMDMIPSSIQGEGVHVVHLRRSTNYEGYGFHLQYNKSYFLVHKVENDSPAAKSGLHVNDVVLAVNQQLTGNMTHPVFVKLVTESSNVDFTVQPVEQYLRSNYRPKPNVQLSPPPPSINNSNNSNNTNNTRKSGLSRALSKLTSR